MCADHCWMEAAEAAATAADTVTAVGAGVTDPPGALPVTTPTRRSWDSLPPMCDARGTGRPTENPRRKSFGKALGLGADQATPHSVRSARNL